MADNNIKPRRDFEKKPYTENENRVALFWAGKGVGGGDDPIGSLMASHEYLVVQRNQYCGALWVIRGEVEKARANVDKSPDVILADLLETIEDGLKVALCTAPPVQKKS